MLVFPQRDPTNSRSFLLGKFNPRGPPAFKTGIKQQEPQEEEIPIWAMAALNISRKHGINPMTSALGDRLKTLTNHAENLISQQGMPWRPEYIFLLACASQT